MKLGKKLCFCMIFLMISSTLYGCFNGRDFEIQEFGDWLYQDNGENSCAIMGLSESGKEKNVLVLPTTLNGKKVDYIGYQIGRQRSGGLDLSQSSCKKIYSNSYHLTIITGIIPPKTSLSSFIPTNNRFNRELAAAVATIDDSSIYLSNEYYYSNLKNGFIAIECYKANIEYFIDDKDCFFVDYVESGKIEVIPPIPYKEGYIFDGWYSNDKKWDYDNFVFEDYSSEDKKLRLEAKWIEESK